MKTAILIDGGFYRKRAQKCLGEKTPAERADELYRYCWRHLIDKRSGERVQCELYRIFYYDCPPIAKQIYHPLSKKSIDLGRSDKKVWAEQFFRELARKRKLALRMGELNDAATYYNLKPEVTKKILDNKIGITDLAEKDFKLSLQQKGVDMRIGLDIASMAYKQQVERIILIAGDSDFVPAAKLARREGIDFILDPLGHHIRDSLSLHIDGLQTRDDHFRIM